MKTRPFNTCLACLCFLLYSSALPRTKEYRPMSTEYVPGEGGQGVSGETLSKEPTCEELRAMWRFSKRQSRAAEITNEIPTYRDPFVYNVWEEYARPRSAGRGRFRKPPIYGRVVHSASHMRAADNSPERIRAFEEVAHLFGTAMHPVSGVPRRKTSFRLGGGGAPLAHMPVHPSQAGSFQHLKELIRTERARELQEQRTSEEAERNVLKEMGKLQYDGYPPVPVEAGLNPDKPATVQNRGVVAFPDILVPASSKYLEEYLLPASHIVLNKYKPRFPDTNTIMGGVSHNKWVW